METNERINNNHDNEKNCGQKNVRKMENISKKHKIQMKQQLGIKNT